MVETETHPGEGAQQNRGDTVPGISSLNALPVKSRAQDQLPTRLHRSPHEFTPIPASIYADIAGKTGRARYGAIVMITWAATFWNGWMKYVKTAQGQSLITRRMMAENLGYSEITVRRAIDALVATGAMSVASKHSYRKSDHKGRTATTYRLRFMEKKKGPKVFIYYGLLESPRFRSLDITTQAILILLHIKHKRKDNQVTITNTMFKDLGIHKDVVRTHVRILLREGFIEPADDGYRFTWIHTDGHPVFHHLQDKNESKQGVAK